MPTPALNAQPQPHTAPGDRQGKYTLDRTGIVLIVLVTLVIVGVPVNLVYDDRLGHRGMYSSFISLVSAVIVLSAFGYALFRQLDKRQGTIWALVVANGTATADNGNRLQQLADNVADRYARLNGNILDAVTAVRDLDTKLTRVARQLTDDTGELHLQIHKGAERDDAREAAQDKRLAALEHVVQELKLAVTQVLDEQIADGPGGTVRHIGGDAKTRMTLHR